MIVDEQTTNLTNDNERGMMGSGSVFGSWLEIQRRW